MKNIIHYAKNEKRTFTSKAFCAVDSLVLSQCAYLYFDGFVADIAERSAPVTIATIAANENIESLYQYTMDSKNNQKLLLALANSPRFRNIKMNYYVNKLDYANEKQFSACTFILNDGTAYVAYRGTDSYFVGWKEDFNMAYTCPVPSQEESVYYLNTVGALLSLRLRIGGHSKGGNLAVYAAMKCNTDIQSRIIDIFCHDGPGFREEVFATSDYRKIKDRIHLFVPQSALIGLLSEHREKYVVIKSSRIGIMQHDPYSWLIEGSDFVYLPDVNHIAVLANKTLTKWLSSLDDKKREVFVDTLYSVIKATGAKTFYDLTEDRRDKALAALDAIRGIDEETRRFVRQVVRSLILMAVNTLRAEK